MEMINVESSAIEAIGYDPEAREITVMFKRNGALYTYPDCSQEEFDEMLTCDSVGTFLNTVLKYKTPPVKEEAS